MKRKSGVGATKSKKRNYTRKSKSLLILECDSKKLTRQSLEMAEEIKIWTKLLSPLSKIETIKTDTITNLLDKFNQLSKTHRRIEIITVVGHSNATGLCLTEDGAVSWNSFAQWVTPFKPKEIVLIACQSGDLSAVKDMFEGVPSLKDIYAPPLNTTKQKSEFVKLFMPYLLNVKIADDDIVLAGQCINAILTGGLFIRYQRKDFKLLVRRKVKRK